MTKLSGGAPNNFTKLKNEKVFTPFCSSTPRFHNLSSKVLHNLSELNRLGPGEYHNKQNLHQTVVPQVRPSFAKSERFDKDGKDQPGPGMYNADKPWTKKTFNLRYLNY
jgi:hypothetical protein